MKIGEARKILFEANILAIDEEDSKQVRKAKIRLWPYDGRPEVLGFYTQHHHYGPAPEKVLTKEPK